MSATATPTTVALLGFTEFERQALALALRRVRGGRASHYRQVLDLEEAQFIVADGDDASALTLLEHLDRLHDTIFVGLHSPRNAAAWLMRPVAPERVMRELEALLRLRTNPDSVPLPLALPSEFDSGFSLLDTASAQASPGASGRRRNDRGAAASGPGAATNAAPYPVTGPAAHPATSGPASAAAALPASPSPQPPQPPRPRRTREPGLDLPSGPAPLGPWLAARALIVDDSAIARLFLRRLLQPYALEIDEVASGAEALAAVERLRPGLVFLDLDLGDGQRQAGLKLCDQIRHGLVHPGGRAPIVVVVSAFDDPVDQVRGTLAGAEAFLGKPLDAAALDRLLRGFGFERKGGPLKPARAEAPAIGRAG